MNPTERVQTRRPWHLWAVGLFFLALYAGGARDYALIWAMDSAYFAELGFGAAQAAYFTDYPALPRLLWTVNILAGPLAPVFVLLCSRWALPLAFASAAGQVLLLGWTFALMGRWAALGPGIAAFDIAVGLATVMLWRYCAAMRSRGVLR